MYKIKLTALAILFTTLISAEVSQTEKEALLDFYVVTNGEDWNQSWDLNEPVSTWQGVTVKDNKVVGISLLFNNISGVLPHTLGDLVNLEVLELSFNKIRGSIPTELGNLTNLKKLSLNGNELTGQIPASIGNLKSLKQLHLSSNKLGGVIPVNVGNLRDIEVFNVFDNNLVGKLPSALATNKNLKELMVAENHFNNANEFSVVLMSNTSTMNFEVPSVAPSARSVIAIETSEDEN